MMRNIDSYITDVFHWKNIKNAVLTGRYDMPEVKAVHNVEPRNLIPFHLANTTKKLEEKWFHFYIDDYRFERIWKAPEKYKDLLKKFEGGISTDFSVYVDMPRAQQIWNNWRNRCMTYFFQTNGINVIPNVSWSDEDSLEWAFDGLPNESVLSITTQGCLGYDYGLKQSLLNGLHELVRQKKPEKLIVYGRFPKEWLKRFPMKIVTYKTFLEERLGE